MCPLHAILPLVATLGILMAEPSSTQSVAAEVTAAARQAALEKILSERGSPAALDRAITAARAAGVSGQAMLEARFLYHVDRREDEAIAAMLPDVLKQREAFKLEDSAIFSVEEDWLAVVEYVQAIAALGKGDKIAFKKHITEAFWLSPRQAAAFSPHIESLRLEERMAIVRIDFSIRLAPVSGVEPVTLGALIDGKKALLLHFWSPWSRECDAAMPDFIATAGLLASSGIAVVSLLPDGTPELLADAGEMIRPHRGKPCGAWLIDPKRESLARQMRVQNLPTMIIASTEGKVLFNGNPADERFWNTLNKIDARLTRPASAGDGQQ